jgi:magnesium-protoporphyrin O-methyltransferase
MPLFFIISSSIGLKSLSHGLNCLVEYFNKEGFERWNKIYSNSDEVNKVQLDIRTGHQQTIDKVINWLKIENNSKKTLCDAGCGVGSLALPLSSFFKDVYASDISASMTNEAAARAKTLKLKNVKFEVSDLEKLKGSYDTVTCIDVMIHYPTDKVSLIIIYLSATSF